MIFSASLIRELYDTNCHNEQTTGEMNTLYRVENPPYVHPTFTQYVHRMRLRPIESQCDFEDLPGILKGA